MKRLLAYGAVALLSAVVWFVVARQVVLPRLSGPSLMLAEQVAKLYRDDVHEMLRSQCQILGDDPRLKSTMMTPGMDEATIVDILDDLKELTGAEALAVLSPNGRVRGQLGVDALRGLDVSSAALVRKAQASSGATSGVWTIGDRLFDLGACAVRVQDRPVAYLLLGRALGSTALAKIAAIAHVGIGVFAGEQLLASAPEGDTLRGPFSVLARDPVPGTFKVLGGAGSGHVARILTLTDTPPPARLAFVSYGRSAFQTAVLFIPIVIFALLPSVLFWRARRRRSDDPPEDGQTMVSSNTSWMALVIVALGGLTLEGCGPLDELCATTDCELSTGEWTLLKELANLPDPPPDRSNKYVGNPDAIALGKQFYFDPRFSGNATLLDTLRRPMPYARSAKGQPTNISCNSCHDIRRGGADFTSVPGNVSVGAGWYDVNAQPTVNSAYYDLIYWNGRNDSLWAQIIAVGESFVSMAGNRLQTAWVINDRYKAAYEAVFTEYPLPLSGTASDLAPIVEPATSSGGAANPKAWQCKLELDGVCPTSCVVAQNQDSTTSCWPRFPLQGRPGSKAGCQGGDATEPFSDAFDCMATADQDQITRAYVNFAKAIAAFEYTLVSRNAPFDRWIEAGAGSGVISDSARRGARLFIGKGSCIDCHNTSLFSDNLFHNVGVPQSGVAVPTPADCPAGSVCDCTAGTNCLPWGALDGLAKLGTNKFRRDSKWSDDATDASRAPWLSIDLHDAGVKRDMEGSWRTPSLRNVALTAPYMHDGVYQSLDEVVWAYNLGGLSSGVLGQRYIRPLLLDEQEQADLTAFLETLTGEPLPADVIAPPTLP